MLAGGRVRSNRRARCEPGSSPIAQQVEEEARPQRVVDVLGNDPRRTKGLQLIEGRGDDADHVAVGVEQGSTRVAGLNRCVDLKKAVVTRRAGQRVDAAKGCFLLLALNGDERIAEGDDIVAFPEFSRGSNGQATRNESLHPQQRDVVVPRRISLESSNTPIVLISR